MLKRQRLWMFYRYRQFHVAFLFFTCLLVGIACLFPGAAGAEEVLWNSTGVYTNTPIPADAKNSDGQHQYGLSEPHAVWGAGGWPLPPNSQGYPTKSLFPWSSGSSNKVTVDGVHLTLADRQGQNGYVLGALWQGAGGAQHNKVYIYDSYVNKVYGGGALGIASYNEVHFGAGARANQLTGGLSAGKSEILGQEDPNTVVSYNNIFITGNAQVDGIVRGGWNASGNSGTGVSYSSSHVLSNMVRIEGTAKIGDNIYGGYNEGNGDTYGNSVFIHGGEISAGQIVGGYSSVFGNTGKSAVHGNTVTIIDGTIDLKTGDYSGVYGGRSQASATGNSVEIFSNTVNVEGGNIVNGTVNGGSGGQRGTVQSNPSASHVHHNAVNISGGSVANAAGGRVNDAGIAEYNAVRLTGGTVTGDVYGAFDYEDDGREATIQNNLVTLDGGRVANVHGGHSAGGTNTGNVVTLAAATVTGNVYAGFNEDANAETASAGSVHGNTVALLGGGTVEGFVYGTNYGTTSASDTAWQGHGNRLDVLGGVTDVGGVGNFQHTAISTGAILNVTGTTSADTVVSSGVQATNAAVFHHLANNGLVSFRNGAANQDIARIMGMYSGGGAIGLEVLVSPEATRTTGDSVIFDTTPTAPVILDVQRLPGSRAAPYTPITRIATFSDHGTPTLRTTEHGYGIYAYDIRRDGDDYLLGLTDAHTGDIGGSYSDGSGTGLAQVAVVSESFVRDNLENAVIATDGGGWGIAANMGYSKQRFNTGNHVDLEGLSALVTLSYHREGTPFAVGVFGETFQGRYKTRNTVALPHDRYTIKSSGELESYGGGVSFQYRKRLDEAIASGSFAAWTPGPYVKALARAGYSKMDFETDTSHSSSFDVGGLYYGATLGGGFVFEPNPQVVMDLYGYGAWTAMAERDVTDSLGQHIDFARADSLRLISGFRAAYKATERTLPYVGLALEWESLGRAEAHIDGYKADTADLSGLSGLIELGVNSKVGDSVFLDFKGTGSVGRRRGIGGMAEIRYTF